MSFLRKSWRKPLQTPQFAANAFLETFVPVRGKKPSHWGPALTRRIYNQHGRLGQLARTVSSATRRYSALAEPPVVHDEAGVALVFMLRAFGYAHAFHNYLVAHALKDLGYHVELVVCNGTLESCGSGSTGKPTTSPPFLCRECRTLAQNFDISPFQVVNIDDFAAKREEALIGLIEEQTSYPLARLTLDGFPIGRWMMPYLLRYVRGHRDQITLTNPEVMQHVRGMVRLVCRYQQMLARFTPACAVFFSGLFAPEAIFYHMSRSLGVATLCTERGPRKNTLFLSTDAACHYRADALWAATKNAITAEQITAARTFVEGRTHTNLDPSGRLRPVEVTDRARYDKLAKTPYTVFFPAVFHDTASMEKPSIFGDIFAAIDALCEEAIRRSERLVIRSHPDEAHETSQGAFRIHDYLAQRGYLSYSFIQCLPPEETWNAYLLAANARATVIYNGTLGMELPALGYRIHNLARSHYTGKGFTCDIDSIQDVTAIFDGQPARLEPTAQEIALRYWHFYFNIASLDVTAVMDEVTPSQFQLKSDVPEEDIRATRRAIRGRTEFLLKSEVA